MLTMVLRILVAAWYLSSVAACSPQAVLAQSQVQTIYADALADGWSNWSWGTTVHFNATSPVHDGVRSLAVSYGEAWAGLYLHSDQGIDVDSGGTLRFWIHGGETGGQQVIVRINAGGNVVITPQAGIWTSVAIPLDDLGVLTTVTDLTWQENGGAASPTYYVDDIRIETASVPPGPPGVGPTLRINAASGQHAISPDIYGMNFADEALAAELRLPVRRNGGNSASRYNWQLDTYNTGSDWYFENISNAVVNPFALPDGSSTDTFVEQDRRTGAKSLLTVPMLGYVAKRRMTGHPYDCGFKVSRYGAQQSVDPWDTDCGNGVPSCGGLITGNDPTDTSQGVGPTFAGQWIAHLTGRFGTAAAGGVAFYNLDNEPMLWNSTHRDVHPAPVTYNEIMDRTIEYATAIKTADAGARILGPVVWGWCAYFYSAADGCSAGQDYQAHGNMPFVDWYLSQLRQYETGHGQRLLDYLDLHYYPQASGVALSATGGAATQALRLRAVKSLWDPAYRDESWIAQPVRLLPRMRDWVATHYPGTRLAITEYNFGGLESINGALAQADVLGVFGREGLHLATLWAPPEADQPGAFAFRMYRNYDGAGNGFGETGVSATSTDQDTVAIYAARRNEDQALTVVVLNKTGQELACPVLLNGFGPARRAEVYRYSAADLTAIVRQTDQVVGVEGFSATFPGNSITLFILPRAAGAAMNGPLLLLE